LTLSYKDNPVLIFDFSVDFTVKYREVYTPFKIDLSISTLFIY